MTTDGRRQRRPYHGSCRCGSTRYIAFLNLPHEPPSPPERLQNFYRCNCNACHKAGILHARLDSSPDDFLLLSHLDPFTELGDYQCDNGDLHFFFCRTCGGRCFTFMGEGEVVDVDLGSLGVKEAEGGTVKAWRAKKEGWVEDRPAHGRYLSVNAYSLDKGQEGLDLREWYEKKWVGYVDRVRGPEDRGDFTFERPHPGGVY